MAWSTANADRTAKKLHQPLRDRQAHPGSVKAPAWRGVSGLKSGKQFFLVACADPDAGIAHLDAQAVAIGIRLGPDLHHNFSCRREFDGVTEQMRNSLAQAARVGRHEARRSGFDQARKGEPFAHGVKPVDTRQFADQSVEIKFAAFQGVVTEHETRQIAGIIENVRQRLARGTYRSDQLTHPRRVFRLFCEMRSPDDCVF